MAIVAGSNTEPPKKSPTLIVKAKKLILQKGKICENLTKKIYGIGGRRTRVWTKTVKLSFGSTAALKLASLKKLRL